MKRKGSMAGYTRLKTKTMLLMLGTMAGAILLLVLLYELVWAGRGADFVVHMFQLLLGLDYERAFNLYHTYIRGNANIIVFSVIAVVFCAYLYFFISRFTAYFKEINAGIDALVREGEGEIRLSPEMEPIEQKLNTVRQNLADRAASAKEAEQRKNDLVMYLAHDIRTPLTSVIGYLSLMDEAPDMPAEQRARYVRITLEKAIRLEGLVNEFFEITRTNSQALVLQKQPIDLHYMLVQLLDEFYPILSAKGSTAVLRAEEGLMAYGDAEKLARVFNNLLKNAAAHGSPGTKIIVSARAVSGGAEVTVQNTGPTIPPEKLALIFDKFVRLDDARASGTGGAGLGLSIARDILAAHGGTITAASEKGTTTFALFLPGEKASQ